MAPKPKRGVEMTEQVIVRLTSEEKVTLAQAAARLDMTVSDFIRFLCLPYARQVNAGAPVTEFRENVYGTAAGSVDYFAARYAASLYSPSPSSGAAELPKPKEKNDES